MTQKSISMPTFFLAIFLSATVSGVSVYFWQQNTREKMGKDQKVSIISEVENETKTGQNATMAEYVDAAQNNLSRNNYGAAPPKNFVRLAGWKGLPLNVKTKGASAPVYVYAQSDWETYGVQDVQPFYLKCMNPMFAWEGPKTAKQEYWAGPFYGKLKLLF